MRFDIFKKKGKVTEAKNTEKERLAEEKAPQIRIVFMGTPVFAERILETLLEKQYNVVAVFTNPDTTAGRKQEIVEPPVKTLALKHGIPIEQPNRLDETAYQTINRYKPDLIIVAAYGKILPKAILDLPGLGCLNVHASLLPRWRGASPIQNALLQGDTKTGITIMLMDEGLDTGPIIAQKVVDIAYDDTAETLTRKLTETGADLLHQTLPLWIKRRIEPQKQNEEDATLCQLIEREDGRIFWNKSAEEIYNQFRAFHPWPGVFTYWKRGQGEFDRIKIHSLSIQKTNPTVSRKLGEVFEVGEHIAVQTGEGLIFIEELQLSGKDRISVRDFLNGHPDFLGSILD